MLNNPTDSQLGKSLLSDEQLLAKYSEAFDLKYSYPDNDTLAAYASLRAVADAAVSADRALRSEPVAYRVLFSRPGSVAVDVLIVKSLYDAKKQIICDQIVCVEPLYTAPPAAPNRETSSLVNVPEEWRKALHDLVRMHRHMFGLDGAWDRELVAAERLLDSCPEFNKEQ